MRRPFEGQRLTRCQNLDCLVTISMAKRCRRTQERGDLTGPRVALGRDLHYLPASRQSSIRRSASRMLHPQSHCPAEATRPCGGGSVSRTRALIPTAWVTAEREDRWTLRPRCAAPCPCTTKRIWLLRISAVRGSLLTLAYV